MESTTFKIFGAMGPTCQTFRIEEGLIKLGCETSILPDFIYCNDAGCYDEAINYKKETSPESYLILNYLDFPTHLKNHYDINKVRNQLLRADKITCISFFVQSQIKEYFELDADVIYNPIQDITYQFPCDKYIGYKYLIQGRSLDPNKRTYLAKEALANLGATNDEILCIGPENPGFGNYIGIVSIDELNYIYNTIPFVFALGATEGLGLVPFEVLRGNIGIPIILKDCTTYKEFFGDSDDIFNIEPNSDAIVQFVQDLKNPINFNFVANKLRDRYSSFILSNLTKERVARRILDTYDKRGTDSSLE